MATILVVDDDSDLRGTVERMLARAGYDVNTAANGAAALEAVRDAKTDLVITDVHMPEKDGIELIMALRELAEPPRLIAISGGDRLGGTPMLEAAGDLGGVRTLPKPFEAEALLDLVAEVLAA